MNVAALVLAAGGSARLGQPKQLLRYRGQSLVRRTVAAAIGGGCDPVAVVVGREREMVAADLQNLAVKLVRHDSWADGIGSSLRAGVQALEDCEAVIILACDQPHVDADLIGRLITTSLQTQKSIVASSYAQTLGVPALFARSYFGELLSLGDAQGAKSIIAAHPEEVARIDFPGGAVDLDTPADYRRLPNDS